MIRSYLRIDGGPGLLLIVFKKGQCVFAFDVNGDVYEKSYWTDEDAFRNKPHFRRFESPTLNE